MVILKSLLLLCLITLVKANFPYCDPFDQSNIPSIPPPPTNLKLRLLQVIIRHGARTPVVGTCPLDSTIWDCSRLSHAEKPSPVSGNNLYKKVWMNGRNFYKGTCGSGVLTEYGFLQQINNGLFIRKNYIGSFLPDRINRTTFESKFFIRSTDVPRTFLSGESLLSGLYPDNKRDGTFNVVFNTMDQSQENLVANIRICPKLDTYQKAYKSSEMYRNHTNFVTLPLQKKVAESLNMKFEDVSLPAAFDCWISQICHGYRIPYNISDELLGEVMREGEWQYGQGYAYPTRLDYSKAGIGLFMSEYLNVFNSVRNNPQNPLRFVLYSAHDTTIMPVLNALGAWDKIWPTFASFIVSEYYDGPGNPVRILYNGKPIKLPDCQYQEFCPFDTFSRIVSNVIPTSDTCRASIHEDIHLPLSNFS